MSKHAQVSKSVQWLANAFREVGWHIPAYLTTGFLNQLGKRVKDALADSKLELMRTALAVAYTVDYLARMFLDRYRTIRHVRDFKREIAKSIRTYFPGYTFNA